MYNPAQMAQEAKYRLPASEHFENLDWKRACFSYIAVIYLKGRNIVPTYFLPYYFYKSVVKCHSFLLDSICNTKLVL